MAKINSRISLLNSYTPNENLIDFGKLQPLDDEDLSSWWRMVPGARRFTNATAEAVDKHCGLGRLCSNAYRKNFTASRFYQR